MPYLIWIKLLIKMLNSKRIYLEQFQLILICPLQSKYEIKEKHVLSNIIYFDTYKQNIC